MGQPDLYPFVLSDQTIRKLGGCEDAYGLTKRSFHVGSRTLLLGSPRQRPRRIGCLSRAVRRRNGGLCAGARRILCGGRQHSVLAMLGGAHSVNSAPGSRGRISIMALICCTRGPRPSAWCIFRGVGASNIFACRPRSGAQRNAAMG